MWASPTPCADPHLNPNPNFGAASEVNKHQRDKWDQKSHRPESGYLPLPYYAAVTRPEVVSVGCVDA
jgi:hypothetical protein